MYGSCQDLQLFSSKTLLQHQLCIVFPFYSFLFYCFFFLHLFHFFLLFFLCYLPPRQWLFVIGKLVWTHADEHILMNVCRSRELWLTFSSETEAIIDKAALSPDSMLWHRNPRGVAIKTRGSLELAPHWQLILLHIQCTRHIKP